MPEIRMRPKHQVTLPASLVRQANIQPDDKLQVAYVNGSIVLTPGPAKTAPSGIMAFAGIGRGTWGHTGAEIDASLAQIRDGWQR